MIGWCQLSAIRLHHAACTKMQRNTFLRTAGCVRTTIWPRTPSVPLPWAAKTGCFPAIRVAPTTKHGVPCTTTGFVSAHRSENTWGGCEPSWSSAALDTRSIVPAGCVRSGFVVGRTSRNATCSMWSVSISVSPYGQKSAGTPRGKGDAWLIAFGTDQMPAIVCLGMVLTVGNPSCLILALAFIENRE